jgi:hypothetical protein
MVVCSWVYAILNVASISETEIKATNPSTQFKDVTWSGETRAMLWIMLFGIFWFLAFIVACNEFVVSVATCTWYFSRKDLPCTDGIPGDSSVWKGYWWSVRYHAGSLAFGSCILAIIWFIRAIFEYVGNKMHNVTGNNGCTRCLVGCISCILGCFDRFVRYITLNAYIYMACTSEGFCSSALHSFLLVLKNSVKFAMVDGITTAFMFIIRCGISMGTTFVSVLLIKPMLAEDDQITSMIGPIIVIFILAYMTSHVFIGLF